MSDYLETWNIQNFCRWDMHFFTTVIFVYAISGLLAFLPGLLLIHAQSFLKKKKYIA